MEPLQKLNFSFVEKAHDRPEKPKGLLTPAQTELTPREKKTPAAAICFERKGWSSLHRTLLQVLPLGLSPRLLKPTLIMCLGAKVVRKESIKIGATEPRSGWGDAKEAA